MTKRDLFLMVLYAQLGKPYRWGGDDPMLGFDCSGLVNEGAQSVGLLGRKEDRTAAVWYEQAKPLPVGEKPKVGDLLFWKDETGKVYHVEAVYAVLEDGGLVTIGASGGGSKTTTAQDAVEQNAYVKLRPARDGWTARRIFG